MPTRSPIRTIALVALVSALACVGAAPPQHAQAGLERQIDEYIRPYLDLEGFSGAILVAKNGKVLVEKGYGQANYELGVPNTPESRFHIASVSKPFTAAAILLLQQAGRLRVTDPVSKHIANYPNGDRITIHHLLTHTSGIPNINGYNQYDRISKEKHSLEEIVAVFKNEPLGFEPGARYQYSNSNYNLLAHIVETVSGKRFGEFLEERIFAPLEMKDTAHDAASAALIPRRASGYVPADAGGFENAPFIEWSIKTGNGSLYSTVRDLYRWDRALYTDRILSAASREQMFTPHMDSVGYGWFLGERHGRKVVRINGRSPGFGAELQRYVDDDVCIVVLGNTYIPTPTVIATDIAAMLFGAPYEPVEKVTVQKLDPAALDAYTGRYAGGPDFILPNVTIDVVKQSGRLRMRWSSGADVALIPTGPDRFFDRMFWARVSFRRDGDGRVSALVWRYGTTDYIATASR